MEQRTGPEHGDQCRQLEVGPVVGQRFDREVWVHRRGRALRQFADDAHVCEEVRDEIRAEGEACPRWLAHPGEHGPDDCGGNEPQHRDGGKVRAFQPHERQQATRVAWQPRVQQDRQDEAGGEAGPRGRHIESAQHGHE